MRGRTTALIIGLILLGILSKPQQAGAFTVLCYHEVADSISDPTGNAISADRLIQHFTWLKANGYHVISIDDLLEARQGGRPLPDHAVLLTFDDGYTSFYNRVFPLLQAFQYPAVLALVGSWLDAPPDAQVVYGGRPVPRSDFMTWEQLGEVLASGLVEIASHSYGLHRGILANPQGNLEPALTSRRYDPVSDRYEDDAAQIIRIRTDLARNSVLLERHLGIRPRVMVWPFGRYNQPAVTIARDLGMPVAISLESGANSLKRLDRIQRFMVPGNQTLEDLVWELRHPDRVDPLRVVQVDLDYIYDPDPVQQKRNLDQLLDRIKELQINTVFLQAFADTDGDGIADELYFPNRYLPMRADLFNRVAWQLKTRSGVNVYAWLPVLAFNLGTPDMIVQQASGIKTDNADRRLSPFHPHARQIILDIYEDLARYADFEGLLFHDDAYLTDVEDANPAALAWYREKWQMAGDLAALRGDPIMKKRWTQAKTQALVNWTNALVERVRTWRPTIKTARNLFAETILDPTSETWSAQTLDETLAHNDYAVLRAMPNLKQTSDAVTWLGTLVERVKRHPGALARTIFELQTVDGRHGNRAIPSATLADQMLLLQRLGAVNFGYYPDNFIANQPDANELHRVMSLQTYPYRP